MVDPLPPSVDAPREPVPEGLLRRCHENIVEAIRNVSRGLPHSRIEEEPGVVRIATPTRSVAFNVVFVTEPRADATAVLARSAAFMAEAGVSRWRLEASPGAETGLVEAAERAGWSPSGPIPGMLLWPMPARAPPPPPELRIRAAVTRRQWDTLVKVGSTEIGAERSEHSEMWRPSYLTSIVRGYIGYVGKRPVATSLGLSYHGVAGIYYVVTLPEERGKGYGTALSWRAVMGGRRDGCRASYLQASELGVPVYARMGYRTVATYPGWIAGVAGPSGPGAAPRIR
ncbi:MAG: GNAT family N-acetyltransferase [Thermoplasmata archaeon]|nr:GNAT family N-acetyltransferase [Thermoplasmata archaeon]